MAIIDSLTLLLTANSDPMRKELDKAGKSVSSFKKRFGEASSFGMVGKALKGGGAIAGLALLGSGLKGVTEWLPRVEAEANKAGGGLIGWADAVTKGTFVLREFRQEFENVTGSAKRANDALAYTKDLMTSQTAMENLAKASKETRDELNNLALTFSRDTAVKSLTGPEGELLKLKFDTEDALENANKVRDRMGGIAAEFRKSMEGNVLFSTDFKNALIQSNTDAVNAAAGAVVKEIDKNRLQSLANIVGEFVGKGTVEGINQGFADAAKNAEGLRLMQQSARMAMSFFGAMNLPFGGGGAPGASAQSAIQRPSDPIGFASLQDPGQISQIAATQVASGQFERKKDSDNIAKIAMDVGELRKEIRAG